MAVRKLYSTKETKIYNLMSKHMCEKGKKGEKDTDTPRYKCKKCGALVNKEKKVCKPKEL